MEDEEREFVLLRITPGGLHMMRTVLLSYARGVRAIVPSFPKRDEFLKAIETICERITLATISGEREPQNEFGLFSHEVPLVDSAFTTYLKSFGESIPQSEERDRIIRGYEELRRHIISGHASR
jgi:hypothetical protein